ncbi:MULTISPECIES: efflux transporter outer membrane subunit [unclassified Novosphingobium]|uniref:efflux transporter outer membrane subunit n=1 Tax=unclassified Novosphingobium TaxID=2644732 RepID=UPI001358549F|nr:MULTISPECIES: efflux transporter outer membrane subunit [unclassified Novosphingobium]
MKRAPTLAVVLLGAFPTLAACNLAPGYRPPTTVAIPTSFKEAPDWLPASPGDAAVRGAWWSLFEDPVLDALERKVDVSNQNVAAARGAYEAARALVMVQRSALFPVVTGTGSGGRSDTFASSASGSSSATTTTTGSRFALGIGASWEPDLWGRLGNAVSQAGANAQASAGDLANATLSAQGELATNYVQLRGIDAQRVLLDATIKDYTRALTITTNKYDAGTVAHSDVYQAQTSLSNAVASRQDLDRQRALLEHAIAVLTGENPSTFAIAAMKWSPVVPEVPGVLPATLLERRPDIAASERRVAAANANVGIQRAAYFPQITLTGNADTSGAGTTGQAVKELFSAATSLWSLGLSGLVTLLDFGGRHGQVLQARAEYDQAAAAYRQTTLTAFQQVEDNLVAVRVLAQVTQSRVNAADAANRAEIITNNQYLGGIVDYSQVIVAQTSAFNARQNQIQSVIDQQTATIALVQAIGGDWKTH